MPEGARVSTRAVAGYAALTLCLAGGMALSIHRLGELASRQVAELRASEQQITLAERLRWSGELLVSNGRGFLLSGDERLLARLQETEVHFDAAVEALKRENLSPRADSMIAAVELFATRFRVAQEALVTARQDGESGPGIIQRFEQELLPLREQFGEALDRLVAYESSSIVEMYARANRDRDRLLSGMYGLFAVLVLISVLTAWYFGRLLVRAFRQEHEALDAARSAVAARDELMGMVAHDLRNPLGAITLKAALLRRTADSDRTRQSAESIESVAARMAHLIKTMLDVTTLEAGRFSLERKPCDVDRLVREALEMFENLAASKQVALEWTGPGAPVELFADRERILQVLSNLLGNSLKFTPAGGKVTVRASREGNFVRFEIADTGPGIPRELLPRVFERFWMQEATGKKGTGLGLFIARGIVEAHGGTIRVDSDVGRGAVFSFDLPLTAEVSAPPGNG